jgi:hypothetical protein
MLSVKAIQALRPDHAIEALQACGVLWFALVDTEPVVLWLDPQDQGITQHLGGYRCCGAAHQ